jgi:hypothetical protein
VIKEWSVSLLSKQPPVYQFTASNCIKVMEIKFDSDYPQNSPRSKHEDGFVTKFILKNFSGLVKTKKQLNLFMIIVTIVGLLITAVVVSSTLAGDPVKPVPSEYAY